MTIDIDVFSVVTENRIDSDRESCFVVIEKCCMLYVGDTKIHKQKNLTN